MFSALRVVARGASRAIINKAPAASKLSLVRCAPVCAARSFRFAPAAAANGSAMPPRDARTIPQVEEQMEEDGEYPEEDYDDLDYPGEAEEAAPTAFVTRPAPYWSATALVNGEFKKISSEDYRGKWLVLFFYPLDFTFVCPTEIRAFSDRVSEFRALDCEVVAASVDSEYSHLAWTNQDRKTGGLGQMNIPILSDMTKKISRDYGVLLEEQGIALRGLFIVDPEGILRQATINDLPVGRSVDETLRLIQAFQFNAKHGEVCPSDWKPGQDAMKTDSTGLRKYFEKKE